MKGLKPEMMSYVQDQSHLIKFMDWLQWAVNEVMQSPLLLLLLISQEKSQP